MGQRLREDHLQLPLARELIVHACIPEADRKAKGARERRGVGALTTSPASASIRRMLGGPSPSRRSAHSSGSATLLLCVPAPSRVNSRGDGAGDAVERGWGQTWDAAHAAAVGLGVAQLEGDTHEAVHQGLAGVLVELRAPRLPAHRAHVRQQAAAARRAARALRLLTCPKWPPPCM